MPSFLIASIAFFVVWLVLLFLSPKTRKEQIIMSIIGLVISPGALFLANVDRRGILFDGVIAVGIEDALFAFSLFGAAAVLYQALLGKHASPVPRSRQTLGHNPALHWAAHLVIIVGAWLFVSLLTLSLFEVPTLRAFILGAVMVGIYIVADRKDLLYNALFSGLIITIVVFVIEQLFFVRLYPGAAATLTTLGGVPMEQLVWAAVVGFAVGPLYEYVRHWKIN